MRPLAKATTTTQRARRRAGNAGRCGGTEKMLFGRLGTPQRAAPRSEAVGRGSHAGGFAPSFAWSRDDERRPAPSCRALLRADELSGAGESAATRTVSEHQSIRIERVRGYELHSARRAIRRAIMQKRAKGRAPPASLRCGVGSGLAGLRGRAPPRRRGQVCADGGPRRDRFSSELASAAVCSRGACNDASSFLARARASRPSRRLARRTACCCLDARTCCGPSRFS